MGFFKNVIDYISKASRLIFKVENNSLQFLLDSDEYFTYPIENLNKTVRNSFEVEDGFTISNSDIFLESVVLKNDSQWSGQPRSVYEDYFKYKLNIKSLVTLNRKDIGNYEFTTYKIDDSFILHLIYIWDSNENVFIFDSNGKLFTTLLSKLENNYSYEYQDHQKGEINFDISIVDDNILGEYFQSEH